MHDLGGTGPELFCAPPDSPWYGVARCHVSGRRPDCDERGLPPRTTTGTTGAIRLTQEV